MTLDTGPAPLTLADFEPHVGADFVVATQSGGVELNLTQATALPQSVREQGGFRLEFAGPAQPVLGQGIFGFPVEGVLHEIFIVPIGTGAEGRVRYEAIFF
ncbi:hypothetical protein HZY97_06055 [Sphingomonas sp. R-74633]|uniref:DUF6916 family protein n=1 Tax=Sphingomonas sp. R-74633 TaxID=2751188 RepID=UPI0015D30873|nr:hypothetical protein [Sphingomonas sp. R-74633]NYT40311.1 hypothetical protein [Sphingomonas sp. R-74633]